MRLLPRLLVFIEILSKLSILFTLFTGLHVHAAPAHIVSDTFSIDSSKVVHVTGAIDFDSQFKFDTELGSTIDLPGPRIVVINSPGGVVDVGAVMIQELQMEKGMSVKVPYAPRSIVCVATNQASSMAFNLLTFCDKRYATPEMHSVVHKVALGGINPFVRLTAKNLRAYADDLEATDAPYRQANAIAMHLSLKDYDDYADLQRCWSSAELYMIRYLDGIVNVVDENQ